MKYRFKHRTHKKRNTYRRKKRVTYLESGDEIELENVKKKVKNKEKILQYLENYDR